MWSFYQVIYDLAPNGRTRNRLLIAAGVASAEIATRRATPDLTGDPASRAVRLALHGPRIPAVRTDERSSTEKPLTLTRPRVSRSQRGPIAVPKVPNLPRTYPLAAPGPGPGEAPPSGPIGIPVQLEARVANGIWTHVKGVADGIDVGVGGRWVWFLRKNGSVWKVDGSNAQLVESFQNPVLQNYGLGIYPDPVRISGSWPFADSGSEKSAFVAAGNLTLFGVKIVTDTPVLVDISAQEFEADYLQDGGIFDVFGVGTKGELFALVRNSGLTYWMPINLGYKVKVVRVASARKNPNQTNPHGLSEVWFIRDDDEVANLVDPSVGLGPASGGAWDLGVGANGIVWAVGTYESPDPGSHGSLLWRFDPEVSRWDWISPGWGVAVDVDSEGNPWVLDDQGNLFVRGHRVLGINRDMPRGEPGPNQSWNDYFIELALHLVEAGKLAPLSAEAAAKARSLGAGGATMLRRWDEVDYLLAPLPPYLSRDPGFDTLFALAPIFTTNHYIPKPVLQQYPDAVTAGGAFAQVDFLKLVQAFRVGLLQLSSIPGFRERVRYLSIGNEVDVYFRDVVFKKLPAAEAGKVLGSYIEFCKQVISKIRKTLPNTKIGVCMTHRAASEAADGGAWASTWHAMADLSDVVIVTYYAVDQALKPVSPAQYKATFDKLLKFAGAHGKPLVLQEVGMPTYGTAFAQAQADFVDYVFDRWESEGGKIRFLSWWPLFDYFYDPSLAVELTDPNNVFSPIKVIGSSPAIGGKPAVPKTITPGGLDTGFPFIGAGNAIAPFFNGPRPGKPPTEPLVNNIDVAYWLNQSAVAGPTKAFCQFLSTCGLASSDGTPKPAWVRYHERAKQLGVQAVAPT